MAKSALSSLSYENPPEMERLLNKYKSGNMPSIFCNEEDESLLGNNGEEIINIYLAGFSKTYNIPLYLFPINYSNINQKLQEDKGCNLRDLITSCEMLQSLDDDMPRPNKDCRKDCIEKIIHSKNNKGPLAYMCCVGMISFAVPVYISDKIVGILLTRCYKPKEDMKWKSNLIQIYTCQSDYLDDPINTTEWQSIYQNISSENLDIWAESKKRILICEEILNVKSNELLDIIEEKVKENKIKVVTSEYSEYFLMKHLYQASEYLTEILSQKYKLEKDSIIGWIRAEMGSSLSLEDDFWNKIQWCLSNLAKLIGIDYILLISYNGLGMPSLNLRCSYGIPEEAISAMQYDYFTEHLNDFIKLITEGNQIKEIDLMQYRDLPILSTLYNLYGKGISFPTIVVSANSLNDEMSFLVLGKINPDLQHRVINRDKTNELLYDWIKSDDKQYLITIIRELNIIINVFHSIKKIHETKEEQTNLIESVAHDLKTPIYNIMLAADNLRNARMSPEHASKTITGVVTQLERLNLFAQKAWMLEQIRQNDLVYSDDIIDIYKILSECRDMMSDLASEKSIEIRIDKEIATWRSVKLDSEKFILLVMNLIHNGIKYSFPKTNIEISGWKDVINSGIVLTFANEGIQILDEEKDRIFERHYRAKNAIKTDPTGSGVGLVLVKDFVEHYKGHIDVTSTEIRFGRFLNIFSLYLPGR